ncbi:uncharacterized protein N7500_000174, partial [Penicillium coprophilum]|uniref:uncharacterized protein n=1 Tax=Penicillium coprophilum TaxID=36646 RepID=UPI002392F8C0
TYTKDSALKVIIYKRYLKILEYPYSLLPSRKGYYSILIILKYLKILLNRLKAIPLSGLSLTLRKGILAYSNLGYKDLVEFYLLNTLLYKETI